MTELGPGAGVKEGAVDAAAILSGAAEPRFSAYADSIRGSTILRIAADIRDMQARGEKVLDLTVGDFRPDQFPIPDALAERIAEALRERQTNYPPVTGVPELRRALVGRTREDLGLDYGIDSFLVAGGARPLIYTTYMALVDPGETVVYPVPSWNNHHYVALAGARGVALPVGPGKNFHLDVEDLAPHLSRVRLLALNSPLNPTGTCIGREQLAGLCKAIVDENRRREAAGERPAWILYDQVYHTLRFGDVEHVTPVGLVPEIAPYAVLIDAVSKGLCATGLRVGWAAAPPALVRKMASLLGHYGAWAPRPEQIASARFFGEGPALAAHRAWMIRELEARLGLLDEGLGAMRADGLPVEHIEPQGAIYLSVRFDLLGRTVAGREIRDNEDLRQVLLSEAGFAVIPFEAFGFEDGPGWVRVSVGAASPDEIREGLRRVRGLLQSAA